MSSEDEKKFSLDDLPDEGSVPKTKPKKIKTEADPRVVQLKSVDDKTKIKIMEKRWLFDVRKYNYGWVIFVSVLIGLESAPLYEQYLNELDMMNSDFFIDAPEFIRQFTVYFESILRHPAVFILLTPFIFSFSRPSPYEFEVHFDGINTVKKFLPAGSKSDVSPTVIRWADIFRIEKKTIDDKAILSLHSVDRHLGDIIWYIDVDKKKAVKVLVNTLVPLSHPLRVFLQNEKDLK